MIFKEKKKDKTKYVHCKSSFCIHLSFSKGKRPGARKIAFLITDGQSNVDPSKTIPNAELLKASGVEIFVIAVGNYKTGISEIVKIASPDPKDHVFRVTNMNGLLHVTELAFKSVAPKKCAIQAHHNWLC